MPCLWRCHKPCTRLSRADHQGCSSGKKHLPAPSEAPLPLRLRKAFFENNTFLPRYYRVTSQLVAEIIHAFEKVVSAKEIGCRFNVSGITAMRYFRCINSKEALNKSARAVGERFCRKLRLGNRRNTLCISRFSNRKVAAKDPPSAAADLFRGSLEQHDTGFGTCFGGFLIPNARLHFSDVSAAQKQHTQTGLPDAAADGQGQLAV